jgi:multidrug resistance efflux pump
MTATYRPRRFFWLLGVILLVGTAAGAGWVLNHAPANDAPPKEKDKKKDTAKDKWPVLTDSIICLGHVDVKHGITPLHPVQPGRVVEVRVEEGDPVWAGQMLLRLDDRFARAQLREAKADLEAAKQALAKIDRLEKQQADKIPQQQAAVDAAKANVAANAQKVIHNQKLYEAKQISEALLRASQEEAKALEALVRVEQAKLRELKDINFTADRKRAQADIEAKEAAVSKARLAWLECDLYAPADGTILRLLATEGEVLSQEPKVPAIQFCPNTPRLIRAEVQQEWANRVAVGQACVIEDDTRAALRWTGKVETVSDWYLPRRSKLFEPFQYNDVRTVECLVSVDPGQPRLRIWQRVRVIIRQGGP